MLDAFPQVLIIIALGATGSAFGHSCYICGSTDGSAGQLERIFPGATFPPCDVGKIVKQCPPEYRGCLTQSNGTRITKTCGHLAMNTCKTANRVEYCYCQGDLCNGERAQPQPPPQPARPSSSFSTDDDDDEDEDDEEDPTEGSAIGPDGDGFGTPVRPTTPGGSDYGSNGSPTSETVAGRCTTTTSLLLLSLAFNYKTFL